MESICRLFSAEMITKSSIISHLFGTRVTNRPDYAIKMYVREVFHSTILYSINAVNLNNILDLTDYLDLKVVDLFIDL